MPGITQDNRTSGDLLELVVRLHSPTSGNSSDAMLFRAQAMVKDIVSNRLDAGAELYGQDYVHTRGFSDPGKALAVGRALQTAMEGFRAAIPGARTAVSMILDSPAPDEPAAVQTGPSVEQKDLLNLAKPSQVLITQAFYDRIAHCQLALRSSPVRAGVYEFLWTSEQRLDELQAESELTLTLTPEIVKDVQAPVAMIGTLIHRPIKPAIEPRWSEPKRWSEPIGPSQVKPEQELADDGEATGKWFNSTRAALLGGVIAALVIFGYFVTNHGPVSNQGSPVTKTAVHPAPPLKVVADPPVEAGPAKNAGPVAPKNPPAVVTGDAENPVVASHPIPTVESKPAPRAAARSNCEIAGDLPDYLYFGQAKFNKGDYDGAIKDYQMVLDCDRSNRQARDGLQRARIAADFPR